MYLDHFEYVKPALKDVIQTYKPYGDEVSCAEDNISKVDNMVFTANDKILIKNLYLLKGYNCTILLAEFPEKNWKKRRTQKNCYVRSAKLVAAIDDMEAADRRVPVQMTM